MEADGRASNYQVWKIFTDGAIRPDTGISGLAAIIRDPNDRICFWWKCKAGEMTCNEAEYAAAIFALEQMFKIKKVKKIEKIKIYSDSQIMVDQMSGHAAVNSPKLQILQKRLVSISKQFIQVTFHHIPREYNRLADALAYEAVEGIQVDSPQKKHSCKPEIWEQFSSIWRDQ